MVTSSHVEHEHKFLSKIVLVNHFIPGKRNSKVNYVFFGTGLFSAGSGALIPEDIIYWMTSDFAALRCQLSKNSLLESFYSNHVNYVTKYMNQWYWSNGTLLTSQVMNLLDRKTNWKHGLLCLFKMLTDDILQGSPLKACLFWWLFTVLRIYNIPV